MENKTAEQPMQFNDFEHAVASELKQYPFLIWKTRKVYNLVKRLHKKGYSVNQVVAYVLINT